MNLAELGEDELPELERFFQALPLDVPPENLRQFSRPRKKEGGYEIKTLALREEGRIVGTIGWIQTPLFIGGRNEVARWPINYFILPSHQGRGHGRILLEALREGARWGLVTGGTEDSTRMFDKTGWKLVGHLESYRWACPCLDPRRIVDRLCQGGRRPPPETVKCGEVEASRAELLAPLVDWRPAQEELGVRRTPGYLRFAFEGALKPYHAAYIVRKSGRPIGFFILEPKNDRLPLLAVQVVDLDSAAGHEAAVLAAARETGRACADLIRLRLLGRRFTAILRKMPDARPGGPDVPFRVVSYSDGAPPPPEMLDPQNWRVTYGDHDEYRVRGDSQIWRPFC